jgi:Ca2+-binding RTX toxin-like protein
MTTSSTRRVALALASTAMLAIGTLAGAAPSQGLGTPTCHGRTATIVGTAAGNELDGTAGPDVIVGRGGNDDIEGHGGNDVICGNGGRDDLEGNRGSDRLYGGRGADEAEGGPGSDVCVAEQKESC